MTSGRFGGGGGGGGEGACAPFAHPWIRACIRSELSFELLAGTYSWEFEMGNISLLSWP